MSRRHALRSAILCICLGSFAGTAAAQLPSTRTSPLNTFGRVFGIGYSDGYHECSEPQRRPATSAIYRVPAIVVAPIAAPPAERIHAELYDEASSVPPRPRRTLPSMLPVSSSSELYTTPDISGLATTEVKLPPENLPAAVGTPTEATRPTLPDSLKQPPVPQSLVPQPSVQQPAVEPQPNVQSEDAKNLLDLEPGQQPGEIVDFESRMSTQSSSRRSNADAEAKSRDLAPPAIKRQKIGLQSPPLLPAAIDLPPQPQTPKLAPQEPSPSDEPEIDRQPAVPSPPALPEVQDADLLIPDSAGPGGLQQRQMPHAWQRVTGPPRAAGGLNNRYKTR